MLLFRVSVKLNNALSIILSKLQECKDLKQDLLNYTSQCLVHK